MNHSFLTGNGLLQIIIYLSILFLAAIPLGQYIARVYSNQSIWLQKILGPVERGFYFLAGVKPDYEMEWKEYTIAILIFSLISFLVLYFILRLQAYLPLNPQGFLGMSPDLAFNTAVSFITNTNWQSYSGETTLSHFSQMAGLTVQNFASAAVGMAVLVALIRGITQKNKTGLGNFWVDLCRGSLYILLPLALLWMVLLGAQGVVQTLQAHIQVPLLEQIQSSAGNGPTITQQTIALGPVASQVAIKQLGTNGGGFFNTNSAHPFENPTPLSNFLELLAILLIPIALCFTYGAMVKDKRQGWAIVIAMSVIFIPLFFFGLAQEQSANPLFTNLSLQQDVSDAQPGGNMEGKETRFGIVNSVLWAAATTATANGSVNAMHDSFTPLGGLVPLLLLQFSEVIYGGVGSGFYGMLMFVLTAVFIAGLMVGRTPEYLGKKIGGYEMKMAMLVILIPVLSALMMTSVAVIATSGIAGVFNPGPHGYTEILYAFTSAANNNGSAFAGIQANTKFYNTCLAITMLLGRYTVMLPVLAIAGSMARKVPAPASVGTLATHTPLFVIFLICTIVLLGILTFIPALALGPIIEQLNW